MSSYLITGCSRGLGLELVKQLLLPSAPPVTSIFATARSKSPSNALDELIDSSKGVVQFVQLDVTDEKSIADAAKEVEKKLGGKGLDVLINNAGIQILEPNGASKMHALEETLATNVVAVHLVSSAFIPLLSKGQQKKIMNISSSLGSMAEKDYSAMAPFPSYKVSKAALNMLTVQYSLELGPKDFTVVSIDPGWMKTDLGGPQADLPPEMGAKGVMEVVYTSTKENNGTFRGIKAEGSYYAGKVYDGKNVPW